MCVNKKTTLAPFDKLHFGKHESTLMEAQGWVSELHCCRDHSRTQCHGAGNLGRRSLIICLMCSIYDKEMHLNLCSKSAGLGSYI